MIAPANTGRDRSRRMAVIITDHTNSGMESRFMDKGRMFRIVVMKLMAPRIEDTPARWSLKIVRSTEIPEWNKLFARGG